jgi:hypothetical protein
MIKGNTANEYGDFLIASVKEPYKNVTNVIDWEVLAGLSDSTTVGTVTLSSGSTTVYGLGTNFSGLNNGDYIIVGNLRLAVDHIVDTHKIELINPSPTSAVNVKFYKEPNQYNNFTYEFRFSTTNKSFNEFHELNRQNDFGDLFSMTFNPRDLLYLDVKAEVNTIQPGNSLTFIAVTYTVQTDNGIVESCPQLCLDCTDPFLYSGCATVRITCEYDNLFQPYNLNKPQQVYLQMSNLVSDIFGHQVTYFRTEPDQRTKDVILMEYSLFNVVDQQHVKILVPDNEFPQESTLSYDMFGIEFEEFEIHIVRDEFERAFGYKKKPRERDYMYIPIINKMYMINSIALGDRFNATKSYWKIKLVKYQEQTEVNQGIFDDAVDSFVTGIEEVFGTEIKETYEKDTKPMQYQTVTTSYRDGIRIFQDKLINIVDYDLLNRWTVVSKNYYDLTQVPKNETAIEYTMMSKLNNTQNFAVTFWMQPHFAVNYAAEDFIFGDFDAINGFQITLSPQQFNVKINGVVYPFIHGITFDPKKWYAVIINGSNDFKQLSAYVYSLDPSINFVGLPQSASDNLVPVYSEILNVAQAFSWNSNTNYNIRGANLYLTNLRLFQQTIEFEQHSNVLNQYVVRDAQLATIIDNAIPSLGFQKFRNPR